MTYTPPKVWTWDAASGGEFASINRPIAGATKDAELPVGAHALQLYSLATPNGVKVTVLLEELLEAGITEADYDAWLIRIMEGYQFGSGFVDVNPNSKIPALMDHSTTPPTRVFESGAILQYLARKTGMFGGTTERERVSVEQWLMWQMGGVGPMAGQAHHFLKYAPHLDPPQDLPYAKDRYRSETARLYKVLDTQLAQNEFVAGDFFSIADMAIWPWASLWEGQQQTLDDKPHMARWLDAVAARPGVIAGRALHADLRKDVRGDKEANAALFNQK